MRVRLRKIAACLYRLTAGDLRATLSAQPETCYSSLPNHAFHAIWAPAAHVVQLRSTRASGVVLLNFRS